jgi:4-amino-4-deoxy-L-arabinose transferase-like glycosyltransferase
MSDDPSAPPQRRLRTRALLVPGCICLLALVLRLLYLRTTGHYLLTSDAASYNAIAKNLAAGHGFSDTFPSGHLHETAFRPPLYPFLLAALYWIAGASEGLARVANVVLSVGVVALTYFVVTKHVSRAAAIGSSLAVAVMPNMIANDTFVLDEPLSLLLILMLVHLLAGRRWLWAGVITGLLVLSRPSAQFLVVWLALWVLLRADWRKMLVYAAAAVLVCVPWALRNDLQVGTWQLVTSNGFNWAAMYSPYAQEDNSFANPVLDPRFTAARHLSHNEAAWAQELMTLGIDNLRAHPTYVFNVIGRNSGAFFEVTPSINAGAEAYDGRDLRVVSDTMWVFYIALALGVLGCIARRRNPTVQLFIIQGAYFTIVSLLFVAPPRLRAPLDLTLAVGVGCCADWIVGTVSARRRPPGRSRGSRCPQDVWPDLGGSKFIGAIHR